MIVAETSNGQLRLQGNETITDAKDDDASKFRVGSRNGGAYSFDVIAEVSEGNRREEAIVLTGGLTQSGGGELGVNIWDGVRPISDAGQKKVAEFRHNEIEFKVPIKAPNLGGEVYALVTRMWAPNGMSFTQQQDDGNFVTYVTTVPFSISSEHVTAVWSAWTGKIG